MKIRLLLFLGIMVLEKLLQCKFNSFVNKITLNICEIFGDVQQFYDHLLYKLKNKFVIKFSTLLTFHQAAFIFIS